MQALRAEHACNIVLGSESPHEGMADRD